MNSQSRCPPRRSTSIDLTKTWTTDPKGVLLALSPQAPSSMGSAASVIGISLCGGSPVHLYWGRPCSYPLFSALTCSYPWVKVLSLFCKTSGIICIHQWDSSLSVLCLQQLFSLGDSLSVRVYKSLHEHLSLTRGWSCLSCQHSLPHPSPQLATTKGGMP